MELSSYTSSFPWGYYFFYPCDLYYLTTEVDPLIEETEILSKRISHLNTDIASLTKINKELRRRLHSYESGALSTPADASTVAVPATPESSLAPCSIMEPSRTTSPIASGYNFFYPSDPYYPTTEAAPLIDERERLQERIIHLRRVEATLRRINREVRHRLQPYESADPITPENSLVPRSIKVVSKAQSLYINVPVRRAVDMMGSLEVLVSKMTTGSIALIEEGNAENPIGHMLHLLIKNASKHRRLPLAYHPILTYSDTGRLISATRSTGLVFQYYLELIRIVPCTTESNTGFFDSYIAENRVEWRPLNRELKACLPPHQQSTIWDTLFNINFKICKQSSRQAEMEKARIDISW